MDKVLLEKAAQCKSAVELKDLAAAVGMDLSDEQAEELFARVNGAAPLTDEELETVAGGGCGVSEDTVFHCAQCGNSVRAGDAIWKQRRMPAMTDLPGNEHYVGFCFCSGACFETFKSRYPGYNWA